MRSLSGLSILAAALACTACSTVTGPASAISDGGEVLRGSYVESAGRGAFTVTDGALTCRGPYDAKDANNYRLSYIRIPVTCTDRRNGVVDVTLTSGGLSGYGPAQLNDGTLRMFVFGRAAIACEDIGVEVGNLAHQACLSESARQATLGASGRTAQPSMAQFRASFQSSTQMQAPQNLPTSSPVTTKPCDAQGCPPSSQPPVKLVP